MKRLHYMFTTWNDMPWPAVIFFAVLIGAFVGQLPAAWSWSQMVDHGPHGHECDDNADARTLGPAFIGCDNGYLIPRLP